MANNNSKRLLREYFGLVYNKDTINESVQKQVPIIVPALLQRANKPNANARRYPRPVLEREVDRYQELVRNGQALGELDHPATEPTVALAKSAIAIREIYWDGDDVKGKVEVLTNVPSGKILEGLMRHGVNIGISSRGVGSTQIVQQEGHEIEEVLDDYQLVCFDCVSVGSVTGAGFLKESKYLTEGVSLDRIMQVAHQNKYQNIDEILNDILHKD